MLSGSGGQGGFNFEVAQIFLSAGLRDILVPCFISTKRRLESRLNPQAEKPALRQDMP